MLPVAVTVKARGAEIAVAGTEPVDRFAAIRNDCYEDLVRTAKHLSKLPRLQLDSNLCVRKRRLHMLDCIFNVVSTTTMQISRRFFARYDHLYHFQYIHL